MGWWVYGFMGLWVYGFMGLWVDGFMGLWVYGFMGLWVDGFMGWWVYEFMGLWVYGFMSWWVYGLMGLWVDGLMGLWVDGLMGWWVGLSSRFGGWLSGSQLKCRDAEVMREHGGDRFFRSYGICNAKIRWVIFEAKSESSSIFDEVTNFAERRDMQCKNKMSDFWSKKWEQ